VAELKAELAAKQAAAADAAAVKAAMEAARAGARGGKGAITGGGAGKAAGARGGAGKEVDPLTAKLAEQSAVRERVQSVYEAAMACLHVVLALVRSNPTTVQPLVPTLLPSVLPALGVSIVSEYAGLLAKAAVRSVLVGTVLQHAAYESSPLVGDWARALALVQANHDHHHATARERAAAALEEVTSRQVVAELTDALGGTGQDLSAYTAVFRRLIASVSTRCKLHTHTSASAVANVFGSLTASESAGRGGGGDDDSKEVDEADKGFLPPAALHTLFPILRAVLTASPPLPLLHASLSLLEAHLILPQPVAARVRHDLITGGERVQEEAARAGVTVPADITIVTSASTAVKLALDLRLAEGHGGVGAHGADHIAVAVGGSHSGGVRPVSGVTAAATAWAHYAVASPGERVVLLDAPSSRHGEEGDAAEPLAAIPEEPSALRAAVAAAAARRAASRGAAYGCGPAELHYFLLRQLRLAAAGTLLHVLRAAPRTTPSPEVLLHLAVRGQPEPPHPSYIDGESGYLPVVPGHPLHTFALGELAPLLGHGGLLSPFAHVRGACLTGVELTLSAHAPPSGVHLGSVTSPTAGAGAAGAGASESKGDTASKSTAPSPGARHDVDAVAELDACKGTLIARLYLTTRDVDDDNAAHAGEAVTVPPHGGMEALPPSLARTAQPRIALGLQPPPPPHTPIHAGELWTRHQCALQADAFAGPLLSALSHPEEAIRQSAGRALAEALGKFPAAAVGVLKEATGLFVTYSEGVARTVATAWKTRVGVLGLLAECAKLRVIPVATLPTLLPFITQHGFSSDLPAVREASLAAGRALVEGYGSTHVRILLPVLESFLSAGACRSHTISWGGGAGGGARGRSRRDGFPSLQAPPLRWPPRLRVPATRSERAWWCCWARALASCRPLTARSAPSCAC